MKSPRSGAVVPTGAHPKNTGGKKGRSGARPVAFKEECDGLVTTVVLSKVRAYLEKHEPSDPGWRWCAEKMMLYSKGRPGTWEEWDERLLPTIVVVEEEREADA